MSKSGKHRTSNIEHRTSKGEKKAKRKKGPPRPPGEAEQRLLRQVEALRLRAEEKLPYREIAAKVGVSLKTAYDLVQEGLEPIREHIAQHGWEINMEKMATLETLQGVIAKWYGVATAPTVLKERLEDGSLILTEAADTAVSAAHVVIAASKEVAKLLGLNAPVRVSGKIEHRHEAKPINELAERVSKLQGRGDLTRAMAAAYKN